MAELTFREKLRIEQVRALEALEPFNVAVDAGTLPARLAERAQAILESLPANLDPDHMARLQRRLVWICTFALFVVGAVAIAQCVSREGQRINIYWLLLLILGMPSLSLVVSMLGLLISPATGTGAVGVLWRTWTARVVRLSGRQGALDRGWIETMADGAAGRWMLVSLSNRFWIAYLLGGVCSLILLLIARQFDFFWGTTLLSEDTFVALTRMLADPLEAAGWEVPALDLVVASRYGGDLTSAASSRRTWAVFLLGCILAYGLLPRLLFWSFSAFCYRRAIARFKLPLGLPYYVELARRLEPTSGQARIVDPDLVPPSPDVAEIGYVGWQELPVSALWLPVEWHARPKWAQSGELLDAVVDTPSRDRAIHVIQGSEKPLVLLVDGQRIVDRGKRRLLAKLIDAAGGAPRVHLVVCGNEGDPLPPHRLQQWAKLAAGLGLMQGQLALAEGVRDESSSP